MGRLRTTFINACKHAAMSINQGNPIDESILNACELYQEDYEEVLLKVKKILEQDKKLQRDYKQYKKMMQLKNMQG